MSRILKRISTAKMVVALFGAFVMISLALQCLIPFISLLVDKYGYTGWWTTLFNQNFKLPMTLISNCWATLACAYVGIDRGAMAVATFKNHSGIEQVGNVEALKQIIFQSFIIFVWAVGLNVVFDTDLSLEPLMVAFGASTVLFVGGNKTIKGSAFLAKKDDLNGDGIKDSEQFTKDEIATLKRQLGIVDDD